MQLGVYYCIMYCFFRIDRHCLTYMALSVNMYSNIFITTIMDVSTMQVGVV